MYINITDMIIEKFKYDNGFTCEDKPFKDERGYYHYIYEIIFPNNKFKSSPSIPFFNFFSI